MKIWLTAIVSILVGVAAGFGSTWIEFRWHPGQFEPDNRSRPSGLGADGGDDSASVPVAVVVDGTTYDFGSGQRDSKMKHTFIIKNEGNAPLTLEQGPTSCKCAVSELEADGIEPGGSAKVTLEWKMNVGGKHFRQTAEIYTNDPDYSTIVLEVRGKIIDVLRLEPRDLVLSDVSANEGAGAPFRIYGFQIEDLKVVKYEFTNQETAAFFDLKFEELAASELEAEPGASCGLAATLTVKPGLPLAPINQTIQLETNVKDASNLELSVTGTTVSDISVVGPSVYDHERNVIRFQKVAAAEGAETKLRILVKGVHRHDVRLTLKEVDPEDVLAVALGEARQINNGAVYIYPLSVAVRVGSRQINRLGSKQAKMGKILIETTHPSVKQLPIYVRFAVN
jgi:hypothetical protein